MTRCLPECPTIRQSGMPRHAPACPNGDPQYFDDIAELFMGHAGETAGKTLARSYLALRAQLAEKDREIEKAQDWLDIRASQLADCEQNLASAREEIAKLRAMLDDIEKLRVKRFAEKHNPPCNNYDCDRCYR